MNALSQHLGLQARPKTSRIRQPGPDSLNRETATIVDTFLPSANDGSAYDLPPPLAAAAREPAVSSLWSAWEFHEQPLYRPLFGARCRGIFPASPVTDPAHAQVAL